GASNFVDASPAAVAQPPPDRPVLGGAAMSTAAVTCPECNASVRSARPFAPGELVRCPECANHFTPEENAVPPSSFAGAGFFLCLAGALLLGGGIVAGAFHLAR